MSPTAVLITADFADILCASGIVGAGVGEFTDTVGEGLGVRKLVVTGVVCEFCLVRKYIPKKANKTIIPKTTAVFMFVHCRQTNLKFQEAFSVSNKF